MGVKEKAQRLFQHEILRFCTYGTDDLDVDKTINIMIEFAREMCELQKQKCAESGKYTTLKNGEIVEEFEMLNDRLILNAKNVCD